MLNIYLEINSKSKDADEETVTSMKDIPGFF